MIHTKKPELTDTVRKVYYEIDDIVEYFTASYGLCGNGYGI